MPEHCRDRVGHILDVLRVECRDANAPSVDGIDRELVAQPMHMLAVQARVGEHPALLADEFKVDVRCAVGELRDSRKALQFHSEALSLRRASNDADGEAVSLTSLGTEYAKLGELEKARDSHERAC